MVACKCGLSETFPECDGSHKIIIKNEKIRDAVKKAVEENKHLANNE
jgi:CDGSH-type Zn-finger protein